MEKQKEDDMVLEAVLDMNTQLAENAEVVEEEPPASSAEKRKLLERTKIVKQTWSILEIYQKVQGKKLILDPNYQRNVIWKSDKKVAFIESLYMGILIPPIYVVEIPSENVLEGASYEVVDGKQRLTTILEFIEDKFSLDAKSLEYYEDWFTNKRFSGIQIEYPELTNEMLSSVLDIYVITANSPEFTKYDIFSRLNKGSEPLKVNEIRKAIYQSHVLKRVDEFVRANLENEAYKLVFSKNDIKRYEDFGRFYRSIAFFMRSNILDDCIDGYNSRPREMINGVLSDFQLQKNALDDSVITSILNATLQLCLAYQESKYSDHLVDASIYFATKDLGGFMGKVPMILQDEVIEDTFQKSATTTSNVNARFKRIHEIVGEL